MDAAWMRIVNPLDGLSKAASWILKRKLLILLVLAILAVSISLRVAPYYFNNLEFEVGFDTGIYERFLSVYG
jgi:hypothetical protein